MKIFENFDQNRNVFENLTANEICSKIRVKSQFFEIFENFEQNRNFCENSSEIEIFAKCSKKLIFLESFPKIDFFFRKFYLIQIFSKILTKIETFSKI